MSDECGGTPALSSNNASIRVLEVLATGVPISVYSAVWLPPGAWRVTSRSDIRAWVVSSLIATWSSVPASATLIGKVATPWSGMVPVGGVIVYVLQLGRAEGITVADR